MGWKDDIWSSFPSILVRANKKILVILLQQYCPAKSEHKLTVCLYALFSRCIRLFVAIHISIVVFRTRKEWDVLCRTIRAHSSTIQAHTFVTVRADLHEVLSVSIRVCLCFYRVTATCFKKQQNNPEIGVNNIFNLLSQFVTIQNWYKWTNTNIYNRTKIQKWLTGR